MSRRGRFTACEGACAIPCFVWIECSCTLRAAAGGSSRALAACGQPSLQPPAPRRGSRATLFLPVSPAAVPASVTRLGLSRIVNHLLALDRPLPLDFLIHGELLRDSLGALLSERDITAEATLDIEYTPLLGPPDVEDGPPHDDWVSCVAALRGGSSASPALVSGSYDGQLRVHAAQGKSLACVAEAEAHGGPVTCCAAEGGMVYSGGKDGWVRAWRGGKGGALDGLARMGGRDGAPAVAAVAVAPGGAFVASGGWDSAVRLWRAGAALEDAAAEAAGGDEKGRKRRGGSTRPVATVSECEATLDKHTQCVSGLSWPVADTLVSCGWDHAVRVWDAETRACRDTLAAPRAAFCVAVREGDARCIAAIGGAGERVVVVAVAVAVAQWQWLPHPPYPLPRRQGVASLGPPRPQCGRRRGPPRLPQPPRVGVRRGVEPRLRAPPPHHLLRRGSQAVGHPVRAR